MTTIRRLSLWVLALVIAPLAFAQTTQRSFEFSGMVTAADGKPVNNARVEWVRRSIKGAAVTAPLEVLSSTTSDTNGCFKFTGLAKPTLGDWVFARATADGYAFDSRLYDPAVEQFWTVNDRQTSPNAWLILERETTLRGIVVDSNDQPVPNAQVNDNSVVESVGTDAEGKFELKKRSPRDGLNSRFGRRITVSHRDFVTAEFSSFDGLPQSDDNLRLKIERGVVIMGKVTDAKGSPIEDVAIAAELRELERGRTSNLYAYTAKDGSYRICVPGTRVSIGCYPRHAMSGEEHSYVPVGQAQEIDATSADEFKNIDFKMDRAATIRGHLVIPPALAHKRIYVSARPTDEGDAGRRNGSVANMHGDFAISAVPPGAYSVTAESITGLDREVLASSSVTVSSDKTVDGVELKAVPGAASKPRPVLKGHVARLDGSNAVLARLELRQKDPGIPSFGEQVRADLDGRFQFQQIEPGHSYVLRAWDVNGTDAYLETIGIPADGDVPEKQIRMIRGGELNGTVRNPAGEPCADVSVTLGVQISMGAGQGAAFAGIQSTRTDKDGHYHFGGFLYTEDGGQPAIELDQPRSTRVSIMMKSIHNQLQVDPGGKLEGLDYIYVDGPEPSMEAVRH